MTPRVALIIESSRGYGRGLLAGIARYTRDYGPWVMTWQDRGLEQTAPSWLKDWQGDGIIARVESRAIEKAVGNTGLPAIDVRGRFDLDMPLIDTDDWVVPQLAAEHLLERGFERFAYCGFGGMNYSEKRRAGFEAYLGERGFDCLVYPSPGKAIGGDQRIREGHGIAHEDQLNRWVASLPRPIGVMACNDLRGQQLLNACRAVGVAVPDDMAVVGVDNDELICELADPPLSSVEPDCERIGYEAARLLERMIRGEADSDGERIYVPPRQVVTRQSSDVLAIDDELVSQAVRYIREHACEGINVTDVLRQVPLTRVTLKRRFEKYLGRSPKAEIVRVQLERVKHLLSATDLSQETIAGLCGFRHPEYLTVVFKQKTGQTPSEYRAELR